MVDLLKLIIAAEAITGLICIGAIVIWFYFYNRPVRKKRKENGDVLPYKHKDDAGNNINRATAQMQLFKESIDKCQDTFNIGESKVPIQIMDNLTKASIIAQYEDAVKHEKYEKAAILARLMRRKGISTENII